MKYLLFSSLILPVVYYLLKHKSSKAEKPLFIETDDIDTLLKLRTEAEENGNFDFEVKYCIKLAQFGYAIGYYRLAEIYGKHLGDHKKAIGLLNTCKTILKTCEHNKDLDKDVAFVKYKLYKCGLLEKEIATENK